MSHINVYNESVRPEWTDYNDHMNVAFYVLVFDHATDAVLDKAGVGEIYRKEENKSVFVVESHVTYEQEVRSGDLLEIKTKVLGVDHKRVHLFHEMYLQNSGLKCATNEIMAVHVDMDLRKSVNFSEKSVSSIRKLCDDSLLDGWPEKASRAIRQLKNGRKTEN